MRKLLEHPPMSEITHHYAGVVVYTESGMIIGQQRDDIPGIDNPGMVGTFGGALNPGEDPQVAAWRELIHEETNLDKEVSDLEPLLNDVAWRKLTGEWAVRHFFTVMISNSELEALEVYEGRGWSLVTENNPHIITSWRPIFNAAAKKVTAVRM